MFNKVLMILGIASIVFEDGHASLSEQDFAKLEKALAEKDERIAEQKLAIVSAQKLEGIQAQEKANLQGQLDNSIAEKDAQIAELQAQIAELQKADGAAPATAHKTTDANKASATEKELVNPNLSMLENLARVAGAYGI